MVVLARPRKGRHHATVGSMGSSLKVESAPRPSPSLVRRWRILAVGFVVSAVPIAATIVLEESRSERERIEADQPTAADAKVIEPSGPPVEFDWATDHPGRFPDRDYAISVKPYWINQRLTVHIRLNTVAESKLGSLACSDGGGAPLEGQKRLLPSEIEWSFELPPSADVSVDCRAVFEGHVVEFAVEWPTFERGSDGRLDVVGSDLSRCRDSADPESLALPDPSDDSWAIICDLQSWQASISPGDYWLSPEELTISQHPD